MGAKAVIDNFVGVDVSKHWLDYCVLFRKNELSLKFRFDNTPKGFQQLQRTLRKNKILLNRKTLVVMEHTGIYGKKLSDFLETKKCRLCVENAVQIQKSIGLTRGKDDVIDAERKAHYSSRQSFALCVSEIFVTPGSSFNPNKDLFNALILPVFLEF